MSFLNASNSFMPFKGNELPEGGEPGQVLTKTEDGVEWKEAGGGSVNWNDIQGRPDLSNVTTMVAHQVVLLSSLWVDNRQTVKIDGILVDELRQLIIATPLKADSYAYYSADIIPESQEDNALVFHAETVPGQDISVIVWVSQASEIMEEISGTFKWWSPKMTSDTTPKPYVASASSTYGGKMAYAAFDNNSGSYADTEDEENSYIQFDFGAETYISGIRLMAATSVNPSKRLPKIFTLYGSNDARIWNIIYEADGTEYPSLNAGETHTYTFKTKCYRYYRLINEETYSGSNDIAICEWEFYKLEETT